MTVLGRVTLESAVSAVPLLEGRNATDKRGLPGVNPPASLSDNFPEHDGLWIRSVETLHMDWAETLRYLTWR